MSDTIEVRVPNIGDFHDLPIIAVLVKPGDTVALESPLVELESEKATMEVPSPAAGVVADVAVKLGDKVSEGSTILTIVAVGSAAANGSASPGAAAAVPVVERTAGTDVAPGSPPAPPAALIELRVPDIGDFANIPVIDVLVAPGDRIEREASLVTLESEKATMEVPAAEAGTVRELRVKAGDRVSQGSVIALLEPAAGATLPPPAITPSPVAAETARVATPSPLAPAAGSPPAESNGVVHASPSIRRFARELGLDLHGVAGTGPHGRITREDVQTHVKRALAKPPAAAPPASGVLPFDLPPWPKPDFAQYGTITRVPLSRIRKFSGPNLHRNWVMIPHVTNNDEADVTELEAFRKQLNVENPGAKVTMLAFVVKACVAALRAFPDVNASLDGDELIHKDFYNIGFAADTPLGLVVPVLKHADRKGVLEIAAESAALAAKARDGKLGMGDMSGATFTISSLGGIGGTSFTPIVNAPEVAILGLSRAAMKPVWDPDAETFRPRLMLPLSLSYDHRVIDGALAARFNAFLVKLLGDLRRSIL
jgi:pyruvate dehydrogenase E2 component (dihydrolipoamide acetyltransferase)